MAKSLQEQLLELKGDLNQKGIEVNIPKSTKPTRASFKTDARKRLKDTDDMYRETLQLLREMQELKEKGSSKWFPGFRRPLRLLRDHLEENGNPEMKTEQKKLVKKLW